MGIRHLLELLSRKPKVAIFPMSQPPMRGGAGMKYQVTCVCGHVLVFATRDEELTVVGTCPNCGRDLTVSECSILEGKEV